MNFFTRFKLFFKKKIENSFPIDNILQLEECIKNQEKILNESKQNYYNSKGKEDYYNNEIKNNKKLLKDTLSSAKKAKNDNNIYKLKKLYEIKKLTENKIKIFEENYNKQKEITLKLNKIITNLENKITKAKCDFELLKTKQEFINNINSFSNINSNNSKNDFNLDDIMKDININYNAKTYEFNDIEVEDNFENYEEDFNSFVKEIEDNE